MENITKRFPGIVANSGVGLRVKPGAFHAVIGENGAGKSTLLNILYGRYRPDEGRVFIADEEVTGKLRGPADAIRRGVGLVSQHYALIPALTVLENIVLGAEPTFAGFALDRRRAEARIAELAARLGLPDLDLNSRAERLSIAAQQKAEILKALYRDARILLLDEPTATLAPQEANSLFLLLKTLTATGATIVFVTHKLREVMQHSDAVTVLRAGRNAGDYATSQTNADELLHAMIGPRSGALTATPLTGEAPQLNLTEVAPPNYLASSYSSGGPLLQIEAVSVRNARRGDAVKNASIEMQCGEIIGIAGVDGSGQRELAEALVGLRRVENGKIFLGGTEITRQSVQARRELGIAYIPEDRHRVGMISDFSVAENYLLGRQREPAYGGGKIIRMPDVLAQTETMLRRGDVRAAEGGANLLAGSLSGGNQQKIVIARAMAGNPRLLVACQPTRGLDVEASRFVYKTLREARAAGLGVLLFSLDLDEIMELSDRIAVMFSGKIAGILPRSQATPEALGALMTGVGVRMLGVGNADSGEQKAEDAESIQNPTFNIQNSPQDGAAL